MDWRRRKRGCKPSALTISSWYFSGNKVSKLELLKIKRRTIAGKVTKRQSRLALNLQTWAFHKGDEAGH